MIGPPVMLTQWIDCPELCVSYKNCNFNCEI